MEYDDGPAFPDPTGASMALIDPALDNNVGANWCTSSTPYGDGDLGTPGAANDCVVEVPELVINEIIQNPAAVSDTNGEWLELFNPTADAIDIDGFTLRDDGTDSHVIDNGGPLVIAAGGYLVLGRDDDFATNGGVIVDYQYSRLLPRQRRRRGRPARHLAQRGRPGELRRRRRASPIRPARRWRWPTRRSTTTSAPTGAKPARLSATATSAPRARPTTVNAVTRSRRFTTCKATVPLARWSGI